MIHREAKGIKAMNQKNEFRWADVEPWCVLRMVLRNCWMLILAALIAGMGAKLALDQHHHLRSPFQVSFCHLQSQLQCRQ